MGFSDRDYAKADYQGGGGGGGGPRGPYMSGPMRGGVGGWSITKWLIVINVAVFVIDMLFLQTVAIGPYSKIEMGVLKYYGHFSIDTAIQNYEVWRFLTFQFLHGDLFHLGFNMYALYIFGNLVERYLGSGRYLWFYLLSGIAGPLAYMGIVWLELLELRTWVPMVGASAGVFGVLIATARLAPEGKVQLIIPPMPMKLKHFALLLVGIAVFVVLTRGNNAGGEAAHLGGALVGFLLIGRPGIDLLSFLVRLWPFGKGKRVGVQGTSESVNAGNWQKKMDEMRKLQEEVDRILLKIDQEGMQSLTDKEKQTLVRATELQRGG